MAAPKKSSPKKPAEKPTPKMPPPKMSHPDIEKVFATLSKITPQPKTELNYDNPYTLLVAVALSAQATDVSVNKATAGLFKKVQTPEQMLALGLQRLKDHIRTIGLYNTKAENIMKMAALLIESHGGSVPKERDSLEALPGVGRKTANVVLNEAFGVPTIAVDTHIFRVGNRTGLAVGATPLAVEKQLEARVPPAYHKGAHHWLILHGRYICTARKPKCGVCPIAVQCRYRHKTDMP